MKNNKLTIEDLYGSEDYAAGLQAGKNFSPPVIYEIRKESNEPIVIDTHNWFYLDPKNIILIHEVYENDNYIKTDKIVIAKKRLF